MRILFIILIFAGNVMLSISQHWTELASISGYQNEEAGNIAVDNDGYIYVTGIFAGEAFIGDDTLQSIGIKDIFLAKYDTFNNPIWIKQIKGPDINNLLYSRIIGFDNANNIYLSGYFYDEISIDSTTYKSRGGTDIFIAKFNSSGDYIWSEHEGSYKYEGVISGSVDKSGNIVVAGFFHDFTFIGNKLLFGKGNRDIFFAKYNNMGHFKWVKTEGGDAADYITHMTTGKDNSIYLSGYYSSSISFSDTSLHSNGGIDIFLVKYNSFGQLTWARNHGSAFNEYSESVFVDQMHNIYMCGYFSNMTVFDTITFHSNGYEDIFITKYDSNGDVIWAKMVGSNEPDKSKSIVVDQYSNCYITGYFYDDIVFDDIALTHQGGRDGFIAILNKDGNFLSAKQMSGNANDYGNYIWLDNNGRIFVNGEFNSPIINFDTSSLNQTDNYDIFLAEISTSSYVSCIADFSYIYDSINFQFDFTDLSEGEIIKWSWDFDDGDTSILQNPTHTYADYGTYNVCLAITAINPFSNQYCTDTICKQIIYGKPNTFNLGGQVFAGTYPLDAGVAYLYRILSNSFVQPADTFNFDTLGYFYFYQIFEGNYIVKVDPEYFSSSYKKYIPSYFGNRLHWENASLIALNKDNYSADIDLIKALPFGNGEGRINGNIRFMKDKKTIDEGPAAGVEILLMDESYNTLTLTYSDIQGNFSFSDLAFGTYNLYAEITGIKTNPVTISLDPNNPVSSFINLIISNNEIFIGIDNVNNHAISYIGNIFPNPSIDKANIEIFLIRASELKMEIYNKLGQLITSTNRTLKQGRHILPINTNQLSNGIYYFKVTTDDGNSIVKKFIKLKAF